jgi:hypothetical protein
LPVQLPPRRTSAPAPIAQPAFVAWLVKLVLTGLMLAVTKGMSTGITGEAKSRQWSRLSRHSESASRLGPPYPVPNPIEPLQKLVRLKLEGRLPRSPPISPKLSFAENPAFPGGVFFLGGAELTDQAYLEGDALRE